ncbi:PilZ domain-containing protein [Vibrio agarivorans]|uniref:PilZ domain-containing protein n=1 Tax=Vibrio agarivorans TaxID=153622 RepID=A0ABT7Y0P3_9VIBR|nr:PilZ domain-containing protein [Vibrio agarivorans]MDN2481600.1 PilZ domain-containing protein [Vibrio agarivorans]
MSEQEFFTVHHAMKANIEPLAMDYLYPSLEELEAETPAPFIVASEFSRLDPLQESARAELKHSDLRHVIELLDTQNAKLNLLLSYMLSQQDEPKFATVTESFGASRFSYRSPQLIELDTPVRAKLFLEHPAAAIYCYGQVTECDNQPEGHYLVHVKFVRLKDTDQDMLIKAALFQQQKLLRQRSLDRGDA